MGASRHGIGDLCGQVRAPAYFLADDRGHLDQPEDKCSWASACSLVLPMEEPGPMIHRPLKPAPAIASGHRPKITKDGG